MSTICRAISKQVCGVWYARIGNCKNMMKKNFENIQASNKMTSQMNVATGNVTSQCFYVKERQIFGYFIHLFLFV